MMAAVPSRSSVLIDHHFGAAASRTTALHLVSSLSTSFAYSSGLLGVVTAPSAAILSWTSQSASASRSAVLTTIGFSQATGSRPYLEQIPCAVGQHL